MSIIHHVNNSNPPWWNTKKMPIPNFRKKGTRRQLNGYPACGQSPLMDNPLDVVDDFKKAAIDANMCMHACHLFPCMHGCHWAKKQILQPLSGPCLISKLSYWLVCFEMVPRFYKKRPETISGQEKWTVISLRGGKWADIANISPSCLRFGWGEGGNGRRFLSSPSPSWSSSVYGVVHQEPVRVRLSIAIR